MRACKQLQVSNNTVQSARDFAKKASGVFFIVTVSLNSVLNSNNAFLIGSLNLGYLGFAVLNGKKCCKCRLAYNFSAVIKGSVGKWLKFGRPAQNLGNYGQRDSENSVQKGSKCYN